MKPFVLLMIWFQAGNGQWIRSGLEGREVHSVALTDSALFAGTASGVYRSNSRLSVIEYLIPRANAFPHDPAVGPDGTAWYTDQQNSYIGKLDTTGVIVDYPTPTPNSGPHGIDVAPDGLVWYTAQSVGRIGKVDPSTGNIQEFVLPAQSNRPHTLLWHGGYIWYTAQTNNTYGRLNPGTGTATVFNAPSGSSPYGLAAAPDGSLWIALFGTNRLGRVDTATGVMQLFTLPSLSARPRRLAVAGNGLVYYTDFSRGYLGRLDPGTSQVREWLAPDVPPGPYGIAIGTDGRVWFNCQGTSAMFAFDPVSEQFEPVIIPTAGAIVRHMVCDKQRGVLWLALSGTQRIGRLDLVRRNWTTTGLTNTTVNALSVIGASTFAGTDSGVFRSTNYGATWVPAGNGLPGGPVSSLRAVGSRLYAGLSGNGVFLSTNNGGNWSAQNNGLTQLSVTALGVANTVLFCGTENGVFSSMDSGAVWQLAGNGLPDPSQHRACGFVGSGASTYAALSHVSGLGGGGVFRTTNDGGIWSSSSSGLNNHDVVALLGYGGTLYAGTANNGVYTSANSGFWIEDNSGLVGSAQRIHALAGSFQTVLAATDDGIWMRSSTTTSLRPATLEAPTGFALYQNYPNPFNPSTTIEYSVPEQVSVEIKVLDVLGREIATLINEEKPAGAYTVTWIADGLASGVYFYRIKASGFVQTKRMLLLR